MAEPIAFETLDFLYTPNRDVPGDMRDLVDALGARVVFAIQDGGIQAALLDLTDGPPRILLTSHVEGDRPIHVYRVDDYAATVSTLRERGWTPSRSLEIPQGLARPSARRVASGSRSTSSSAERAGAFRRPAGLLRIRARRARRAGQRSRCRGSHRRPDPPAFRASGPLEIGLAGRRLGPAPGGPTVASSRRSHDRRRPSSRSSAASPTSITALTTGLRRPAAAARAARSARRSSRDRRTVRVQVAEQHDQLRVELRARVLAELGDRGVVRHQHGLCRDGRGSSRRSASETRRSGHRGGDLVWRRWPNG
jgi:hypothetical protein